MILRGSSLFGIHESPRAPARLGSDSLYPFFALFIMRVVPSYDCLTRCHSNELNQLQLPVDHEGCEIIYSGKFRINQMASQVRVKGR